MKNLIIHITTVFFIFSTCFLCACEDELLEFKNENLQGVDRDQVVDLQIPFMSQNGLKEVVVTRAGQDMDSQISSLLVLVYEAADPKKPELNRFIAGKFYSQKGTDENGGGWFPDANIPSQGTIKTKCPVGDVYIYLIANWVNSFIDFAPGIPVSDLNDPASVFRTQKDLFETLIPTWNGNVHSVDGYVPMIATVANSTGLCQVDGKGIITYFTDNDKNKTNPISIATDGKTFVDPNTKEIRAFDFERLMAKITMNFKIGATSPSAEFHPGQYKLHNGGKHIAPTPKAWPTSIPYFTDLLEQVQDGKARYFGTQTPNSFTIYVPANLEETTSPINSWIERERMVKNENGKNQIYSKEENSLLKGKFKFKNAPKYASYIEVTGEYRDPQKDIISAETRYFIHLGNFSKNMSDFNVKRDHHYTYNVTVRGVEDIIVESKDNTDPKFDERNPAVDGLVYIGGVRAYCDAHFDQVEFEISKIKFPTGQDFAIIFAITPFGSINIKYFPAGGGGRLEGEAYDVLTNKRLTLEEMTPLLKWVRMRKQIKGKGYLAQYCPTSEDPSGYVNIFQALDEAWKNPTKTFYYTAFIDEYYYEKHPLDANRELHLRDFINMRDRSIALGKDIHISKDGSSVSVDAITVVYQKSIATFYDLDKFELIPFGIESLDELGHFNHYGTPTTPNRYWVWDGRSNTYNESKGVMNQVVVNWEKNGWLLETINGVETLVDQGKNRLLPTYKEEAYLAYMTKNRDFNGNGIIDQGDGNNIFSPSNIKGQGEVRWYTPGLNQLLGVWIGEPSLPITAALYQKSTSSLKDANKCDTPIYTSSGNENRVLWAEQGCSFGSDDQGGGSIRCIRNLGSEPRDFISKAHNFWYYDKRNRTIEVYLADIAMRGFSTHELAPHHERSPINRVYKKIQLANHPYVEVGSRYCKNTNKSYSYNKLLTSTAGVAKGNFITPASSYLGDEPNPGSKTGSWRLPNQRELALMLVAIEGYNFQVKEGLNESNYRIESSTGCTAPHIFTNNHNWEETIRYTIHCRTKFSNNLRFDNSPNAYTNYGYMFNTKDNKIQLMWEESENSGLGMGKWGTAGYFCVRDVEMP